MTHTSTGRSSRSNGSISTTAPPSFCLSMASLCRTLLSVFFFFQAEDGIRDVAVTGVQTCALPISFLTNVVFYDWREAWNNGNGVGGRGKTIQAVQLDVARFNAWLGNTNLDGTKIGRASCRERV